MSKLISMVDFVFEQEKSVIKFDYNELHAFKTKISNYGDFIKQPLALGMFVPCDLDGNVLEEREIWHTTNQDSETQSLLIEFEEAKNRVLFKNIEYVEAKKEGDYSFVRIAYLSPINYPKFWNGLTVEHLIKYNLTLTESKAKELGL